MNNIFAVATPLQLLSAYILVNQDEYKGQRNHLILLGPKGETFWHRSPATRQMSTDSELWSKITILDQWLDRKTSLNECRQQMCRMKESLLELGKVDRFFLGADKTIQHQLLVELAGLEHYYRLDDGVWSYYCRDRSLVSKVWHFLRLVFYRVLGDIHLHMSYNLGGVGYGKAALGDYLFKPGLLERVSPQAVELSDIAVRNALNRLVIQPLPALEGENVLLLLGGVLVEWHRVTQQQEISIFQELLRVCSEFGMKLVYKPHPQESAAKLEKYQDLFPEITVLKDITDPIEVILGAHPDIKWVMAHSSSGLIFADKFAPGIKSMALFKIYPNYRADRHLERLMIKSGVAIPKSPAELYNILKNEHVENRN